MILHAGLVAMRHREHWRGLLITGPSGCGKSDLALRLMDAGFSLVADDRVIVWISGGKLYGRAPDSLIDKVEARGIGLLSVTGARSSACPIRRQKPFWDLRFRWSGLPRSRRLRLRNYAAG
jgi:serine kinase of HPr protein (carbohydrate metabolism regulator)